MTLSYHSITVPGIDPHFDREHKEAFRLDPQELRVGDTVFIADHYWPGEVVGRKLDGRLIVESPTLLDGTLRATYAARSLRRADHWLIPSPRYVEILRNKAIACD